MRLFIQPDDVWLFRDGRPFRAGSDHRAASLFPPPPSVLQGALRAAHVTQRGSSLNAYVTGTIQTLNAEIGAPDMPPPFKLHGPFLARQNGTAIETFLSIPADTFPAANGFQSLIANPKPGGWTNLQLPCVLAMPQGEKETKQVQARWASKRAIDAYLKGKTRAEQTIAFGDAVSEDDLLERENRFGNQMNYAVRRPQEQMLYEAEFIRARPQVGLLVEVNGLTGWKERGVLKLGGEGRAARYEIVDDSESSAQTPIAIRDVVGETGGRVRFKMYFATAACFDDGWQPRDWSNFLSGSCTLQAAALTRFEARGGFDMLRGQDKETRRQVPAGSVYYFEGDANAQLLKANVTSFYAELGFGQVLLGRWANV